MNSFGSPRIAVLGAGAWGTALAIQAARAGARVALWARDPAQVAAIAKAGENAARLPGIRLPPGIVVTADATAALAGATLILVAVPMQALRGVLTWLRALSGQPTLRPALLLCAKGCDAASLAFPLEIAEATWSGGPVGILSGPNFAQEIAAGLPAAAVVAAADPALPGRAIAALATPGFRLYGSDDPIGVQVGGAAKNVVAIAAGAVIGAGLGENARAALVTRGLAELSRLTVALGGRAATAAGLSGLGDLLLSATGTASRNYALGLALGRGTAPSVALAEGAATAPALVERAARAGVELPICAAVSDLLAGRSTVAAAMALLLARPLRDE